MRQISTKVITAAVKEAAVRANYELGSDVTDAFRAALEKEQSPVGKEIINKLIENAEIARRERIPICQDTGLAIIFAEIGQDVNIVGGSFRDAVEQGIREGYKEGYLRKSVCDPFTRKNTGDNTPVIIHLELVPGERLTLWVVPKGGGSENMSRLFMLPPSAGWKGIKEKVLQTVLEAGPNPCPPTIIGVGIGGNFEESAILAKKSLLRHLGAPNPDPELASKEQELIEEINKTGVGPQGLGGRITSLAVHMLVMPCHIASLPLAVNIQCHASRHEEIAI
ncbi:MAG: fumarate hydratase [Deltaproteobacteria bacterium CG_4_8_14_3_um_filter_51_11]|nr:fumarate hydratase [bacterium]OIP37291.1 MAG: fumarate hydratase [Desulfobacteraceae bacterium CG2_30_51_40]PIP44825.1 MAG: fumarate hydratase [Deltaproteobacteria bacterium CG23_combo_of_CG06-09_8_20_14_all_51_20]PIX20742.1 MAG: fumarate hydratase [Deltaproteobacteria bacterium CG_4_8_14_3_um_filter_51_11]PJB36279.1 MAG: fumarate hydratase [Deltaproteobacteria bacterium CG_4_9_14_3_um_filter_51_14]